MSKQIREQVVDALLKERNDALARVVKRVQASMNIEKGEAQHSSHSSSVRGRTHAAHITPRDVSSEAVIRETVTRLIKGLAPVDKEYSQSWPSKCDDVSTSGLDPRESSAYKDHVSEFVLAPTERRKRIESILEELSEEERRRLLVSLIEEELGSAY